MRYILYYVRRKLIHGTFPISKIVCSRLFGWWSTVIYNHCISSNVGLLLQMLRLSHMSNWRCVKIKGNLVPSGDKTLGSGYEVGPKDVGQQQSRSYFEWILYSSKWSSCLSCWIYWYHIICTQHEIKHGITKRKFPVKSPQGFTSLLFTKYMIRWI